MLEITMQMIRCEPIIGIIYQDLHINFTVGWGRFISKVNLCSINFYRLIAPETNQIIKSY